MKQPHDSLGRPARPLRYSVKRTVKLAPDAVDTINEMAKVQGIKPMRVMRRAIMKDVYIYKSEQKRRGESNG